VEDRPCGIARDNIIRFGFLVREQREMARKLRTKQGHAHYARRKVIVEPVFGQTKEAGGFRRFHLRGRVKVAAEWRLVCGIHNLGKLFRSGRAGRVIPSWPPTGRSETGLRRLAWA